MNLLSEPDVIQHRLRHATVSETGCWSINRLKTPGRTSTAEGIAAQILGVKSRAFVIGALRECRSQILQPPSSNTHRVQQNTRLPPPCRERNLHWPPPSEPVGQSSASSIKGTDRPQLSPAQHHRPSSEINAVQSSNSGQAVLEPVASAPCKKRTRTR